MIMQLAYLAMNPNISAQDFNDLSKKIIDAQSERMKQFEDGYLELLDKYGSEAASEFMSACLPFLFW